MRRNLNIDWESVGKYSTHLFTKEATNIILEHNSSVPLFLYLAHLAPHAGTYENPLQAPQEDINTFQSIKDNYRRKYAGKDQQIIFYHTNYILQYYTNMYQVPT